MHTIASICIFVARLCKVLDHPHAHMLTQVCSREAPGSSSILMSTEKSMAYVQAEQEGVERPLTVCVAKMAPGSFQTVSS